jgi:hypothetical protein
MDGTSRRLSSEYDANGNRTVLWDNYVSYSGMYGYDGLGRMTHYLEGFGPVAFQPTSAPRAHATGSCSGSEPPPRPSTA